MYFKCTVKTKMGYSPAPPPTHVSMKPCIWPILLWQHIMLWKSILQVYINQFTICNRRTISMWCRYVCGTMCCVVFAVWAYTSSALLQTASYPVWYLCVLVWCVCVCVCVCVCWYVFYTCTWVLHNDIPYQWSPSEKWENAIYKSSEGVC